MSKFSTFIYHSGILYGQTTTFDSIIPDTGPSTGGTPFVIKGTSFLFETFDNYFYGPTLDPSLWSDISSGTGSITLGASHLQLTTGSTASSVSGVEALTSVSSAQFESRVVIQPIAASPTSVVYPFVMESYIDSSNLANIAVRINIDRTLSLVCNVYNGGVLVDSYSEDWSTGVSTFKILRWGVDVYFYANGSLVFKSSRYDSTAGTFRVYATNVSADYDIVNTIVESFLFKTFVVFGNEVVHDVVTVSDVRLRGLTPPSKSFKDISAAYSGLVDLTIVPAAPLTVTNAFEYYFEDVLTLIDNAQFGVKLSDISDLTIRTPSLDKKGLGGGK